MKKLAILLGLCLLATTAFAADSWTGFVTDSKCAADGKAGPDHASCAKVCIGRGGAAGAAVLVVDGKVVKIANQDKVKEFAGEKVTVTGKLAGDSLTVDTIKKAEDKKS